LFKSAYLIDTYASLQKRYHDQPEFFTSSWRVFNVSWLCRRQGSM